MEWSPNHSSSYYLAVAAGLAALIVLAQRFAANPSARSALLLVLRGAALAILLLILLDPVHVTRTRLPEQPPSAVYLVDNSRSMALETPVSRLEQARRLMEAAEAQVPPDQRPRIELFGFGEDLGAIAQPSELRAESNETRLRHALEQIPSRVIDELPRGVIVFSDGRSTETSGFDRVATAYTRLKVPIHVVPLGNARSVGDVAIQDVIVPREARAGARIPIRVVIRSRGYEGERAEVAIRSLADPTRAALASLPLTLADGELTRELVIDAGQAKGPLVVELPPLPNEAISENNRVPFQVAARTGKIRVIYMEGTGNAEYHWIRDALVEDPDIECLAIEVDAQYNRVQRLRRIGDPRRGYPTTREELFGYDVVICSDIHRGAFTQAQLDWTVELVAERGGGFAMIGGNTSFGAGQWDQTVWDGMIPIDMSGAPTGGDNTLWGVNLKIQVPEEVENHPVWKIVDDPVRNRAILGRMPIFYGSNLTDRLKPAATALGLSAVALPVRRVLRDGVLQELGRTADARPEYGRLTSNLRPGETLMPVFTCQSFGKGRSFALSSDSTLDWGRDFEKLWGEGDNRYFRKFWRNVVTWLAENSANANRRLNVSTDKVLYHPGEPVQISVRAFDDHMEPTQKYRIVAAFQGIAEPPAPAGSTTRRSATRSATMVQSTGEVSYQASLAVPSVDQWPARRPNESPGLRKVVLRVIAYDRDRVVTQADLDVQVMDDSPEFRDPRPDRPRLEELARGTGGRVLGSPGELADLLRSYRAGQGEVVVSRAPVWDNPLLWLLLLGLLTTEWLVRRTRGLA